MADLEGTALAFQWGEQAPSAHVYLAPAVLKLLRQGGARRVLDLGCGNGTFTARIVEAGYEVVGIDASASGIKIATRLVPAGTFLEGSLEHALPQALRGQFDAVTPWRSSSICRCRASCARVRRKRCARTVNSS
jgi:SAM-dependent methyltransferase